MNKFHLLLILFCLMMDSLAFSQYKIINPQESMIYTPEKLEELNQTILHHLEKSRILSKSDSIYIYHIFYFSSFKEIRKEDLSDRLFFKSLNIRPIYEKCKIRKGGVSKIPSSKAIILNDNKEFLGVGYAQFFTSASACSSSVWEYDLPILNKGKDLNVRVLFKLLNLGGRGLITFGRTYDDRIIVFHQKKNQEVMANPIEEFIEKYWDTYFY